MNNYRYIIVLIILLLFSATSKAQSVKDSLNFSHYNYRKDIFRTVFEKRLNTYNLRTGLNYSYQADKLFLGVYENYFSSLVTTTEKNIKDEQAISVLGEYKFTPYLSAGIVTQNSIYSTDRKIAINEASNLYSTFFTKISPFNQLNIIPYGGYSINKQVNEDDRGAIYGGNIELDRFGINNFLINSTLKLQNEDIAPRNNSYQIGSLRVKNNLDLELTNIITADYSNTRKDFYFETDSVTSQIFNISKNIQSRTEKKYFIEERLFNSKFNSDLFFDLSGRVFLREIDRSTRYKNFSNIGISSFDSKIEEFRLEFSGTTEYRSESFFGKLRLDYSEREEKHSAKYFEEASQILFDQRTEQEKKKNNISEYTTVSAIGNYFLSQKDNISFSLLHRKLVYNTPSKDNFDDRDELLSIMRLNYTRIFNRFFNFFVNIEGSFNHIVYIFAERSSNNNIRRIIKLNSGGEFRGSRLYSRNSVEVSANYTSYDFEDINPNSRSFSFRQFNIKDSTSIKILGKVHLDFSGYIKLSEQGNFDWKSFSNNPDRYLAEYYFEPMLKIKDNNTKMGFGLRIFSLQTYNYNLEHKKYLTDEYASFGPIADFTMNLTNLSVHFFGWYEFINNVSNIKRELANLTLSINWKL